MSRFQNMNSFCLERTAIEKGFDSNGKQIASLHIWVFGQVENLLALLALLDCLGLKLDAIESYSNEFSVTKSPFFLLQPVMA